MAKKRLLVNVVWGADESGNIRHYVEMSGDSTDSDPTEEDIGGKIVDGSIKTESDTGKVSFYNEKTEAFVEQFSFQ